LLTLSERATAVEGIVPDPTSTDALQMKKIDIDALEAYAAQMRGFGRVSLFFPRVARTLEYTLPYQPRTW
jgi:hypothetical protein